MSKIRMLRVSIWGARRPSCGLTTLKALGHDSGARLLIVNADDFGMSEEQNRGTSLGFSQGIITSASAIVPASAFAGVVRYNAEHPGADIGVHLTLTSEWRYPNKWSPVLGDALGSLTDGRGYMWSGHYDVARRCNPAEAERELRAQIGIALAAGIEVSHLDSHMFVLHGRAAAYRDIYLRLASDFRLPVRAAARALLIPMPNPPRLHDLLHLVRIFRRALLLRAGFAAVVPHLERRGILCPDYLVISGPAHGARARSYWSQVIGQLPSGVTEIYCHPSSATGGSLFYLNDARERAADFSFFGSEFARASVAEHKIELIGYRPLRRCMTREGQWLGNRFGSGPGQMTGACD
jgi:chitin disaccharide deacetylase